ncbi:hypothetical protein [Dyadobacter frigoris]|uniref:Uncharacterized protein n=1 Tax=Dyadobacter frigoris TaxID=2576211 RepID=A0A4U6D7T8_9BACT|nr:hypothetical protein [Dyadobacter frigoris]TKT93482.1 hypothetical protein FDK13_06435 [Dyadobacter frigoris]GLU55792.1 hypothetical protein Dfri01_52530 [Dyadobacter frigoris]
MAHSQKLSDIQLHLLRFFSERDVSNEETIEIQRMIARFYAEKADKLMDGIWEQKGFSEEKMLGILNPTPSSDSLNS